MLKVIEKSICLEPEYLSKNLMQSLIEKARTTWVGKCTKEDGYIINIKSIISIKNNYISPSTTSIVFILKLSAEVLKPMIDDVLEGHATMVLQQGIFVSVEEKLNILVPFSKLDEYDFDKIDNIFKKKDEPLKTIRKGDRVEIKISAIRYEKNGFNCIGTLN
jgi:DNA-directed RNA polymerase subunit E'/Rpb7